MKNINCDIIQDLLPSYIDKTSSKASNELVENHLKKCEICSTVLDNMNKNIDTDLVFNQKERIDYLKGFRKNKILAIIKAVLIFILFIILFVVWECIIEAKCEFFVDVNDINIDYPMYVEKNSDNSIQISFSMSDKRFFLYSKYDESNENSTDKNVYIEVVRQLRLFNPICRTAFSPKINANTERLFLKDKKGNVREVWNKFDGVLIERGPNNDINEEIFNLLNQK